MKKMVIIYGNCHVSVFKKYVENCREFCEQYQIFEIKMIQEVKDPKYFDMPELKICDVFIHQSIREDNRYGVEYSSKSIISKLKPECVIISIPNLYHLPLFMFPQYIEKTELRYRGTTFFFRDVIIDELIKEGKSVEEIADSYYLYQFDKSKIRADYEKFIEKVQEREKQWDIKVVDFIKKNISLCPLFYDPNHPTNYLIRFYAEETLKRLLGSKYVLEEVDSYRLDSYEMPIVFDVKEIFQLGEDGAKHIRISGKKINNVDMNIREYVKQYYSLIWTIEEFGVVNRIKSALVFWGLKVKGKICKLDKNK